MLTRYTEKEMLELRLLHSGLAPSPGLTGIKDYTRLTEIMLPEIRAWYADLLLHADPAFLPTEEISDETEARYLSRNAAILTLPDRCVRPVSLLMAEWKFSVFHFPPIDFATSAIECVRSICSTPFTPHAYMRPDGSLEAHGLDKDTELTSYYTSPVKATAGKTPVPTIRELTAVIRPADGSYIFDPILLTDPKQSINSTHHDKEQKSA